jgi:hypothetical protein
MDSKQRWKRAALSASLQIVDADGQFVEEIILEGAMRGTAQCYSIIGELIPTTIIPLEFPFSITIKMIRDSLVTFDSAAADAWQAPRRGCW